MNWPNDQLEALHACHIAETMFDGHVVGASFVTDRPDLLAKVNAAHAAIADAYQAIGAVEINPLKEAE